MDYRDVVIHIFDEENRLFYDLERIWRDGTLVERERFRYVKKRRNSIRSVLKNTKWKIRDASMGFFFFAEINA